MTVELVHYEKIKPIKVNKDVTYFNKSDNSPYEAFNNIPGIADSKNQFGWLFFITVSYNGTNISNIDLTKNKLFDFLSKENLDTLQNVNKIIKETRSNSISVIDITYDQKKNTRKISANWTNTNHEKKKQTLSITSNIILIHSIVPSKYFLVIKSDEVLDKELTSIKFSYKFSGTIDEKQRPPKDSFVVFDLNSDDPIDIKYKKKEAPKLSFHNDDIGVYLPIIEIEYKNTYFITTDSITYDEIKKQIKSNFPDKSDKFEKEFEKEFDKLYPKSLTKALPKTKLPYNIDYTNICGCDLEVETKYLTLLKGTGGNLYDTNYNPPKLVGTIEDTDNLYIDNEYIS